MTFYFGRKMKNIEACFSSWARWKDRDDLSFLNCPGVYTVAWSAEDIAGETFKWRKEIIYFGVADHLRKRLKQFDDTISERRNTHGGADRALYKYREYPEFTLKLYVAIAAIGETKVHNSPDCWKRKGDARQLEYHCIAQYLEKFRQLPIFNNKSSPKFSKSA